jgi:hypothetical protein
MKFRNQMIGTLVIALLAGCNNAGSDKNGADSTTVTTSNSRTTETQIKKTVELPATVRTGFETKYPHASNVKWNYYQPATVPIEWDWSGWPVIDTTAYTGSFNQDGSDYWVWYDNAGNWIGSVSAVSDYALLPDNVNNTVRSQFPGYTILSVEKENDKKRTVYEIKLEKGNDKMKALIDENGKLIKKKGMVNGEKIKEKPAKDSM